MVRFAAGTRTVAATAAGGVVLTHAAAADGPDDVVVLPAAALAAAAGGTGEPVALDRRSDLRGVVRWADGGTPRTLPVDLLPPGESHAPPPPPALAPVPVEFLAALHECGRTAAREPGRYALSKVQVQGRAGRVVGTDGRTALLWGGLRLPFADDLLVPAVPAFGARPLTRAGEVRVGRSTTHLVVAAGAWAVWLPVDPAARFPDVAGVVPKHAPTVAGFDAADAAALLARLPGLPGADADHRPVTLVLDGGLAVLARDDATGRAERVRLPASPAAGPPARVGVDRRVLARALGLGMPTVRVAPGRPVVFEGGGRTLVTMPLDPAPAGGAAGDAVDAPTAGPTAAADSTHPERRIAVRPETNGPAPPGRPDPPAADPPDPLAEAEALRAALADAALRAGRLVQALKGRRREQKALTQVWSSLRALNLGPGGRP